MREAYRQQKNDAGKYADSGSKGCGKHTDSEKMMQESMRIAETANAGSMQTAKSSRI